MTTSSNIKLNELVSEWAGSPPLVFYKLQKALEDPEVSFQDFADIILADPNLAARLLRIANSAFFSFESKVESITHAINVIGVDNLTELVLATTMVKQFHGISRNLVDMQTFWMHSVACALAARTLAQTREEGQLEPYYLAGLFHDVGSLIIYKELPDEAMEVLSICRESKKPIATIEKEILGFTHNEIGARIFEEWGLPSTLVEAVLYHHKPSEAENHSLHASVVHLADIIVYEMKLGTAGESGVPELDKKAIKIAGMNRKHLENIQSFVRSQLDITLKNFYDV